MGRRFRYRGADDDLNNIDFPENPVLGGGPVRNIMSDGVAPRRKSTVAT